MTMDNPITEEHKGMIDDALVAVDTAKEQLARAKLAGIDVSAIEKRVSEQENRLHQFRQAFFPNG